MPRRPRHALVPLSLALGALAILSACSDDATGGDVGDPCAASSECATGLRCGADSTCEIDPTATTGTSTNNDVVGDGSGSDATGTSGDVTGTGGDGTGTSGDATGNTDGGNPFDFEACAEIDIEFTPVIPTVVLLVDRSGSMVEDFGGITRWQAAQDALFDPVDGVVTRYEDVVNFGLATYLSEDGFQGPECPILTQVSAVQGNAAAMAAHMAELDPSGDTPTGESILGVLPLFDEVASRAPRVLLLATDGEPDTCEVPDPQEGQPESVAAAQEAHSQGVRTFVLSVGDQIGEPHLQDMANAGVGNEIGGAVDAPFWTADDPATLGVAVAEIVSGARPCVFTVQGADIDLAKQDLGVVLLNGEALEFGTDWEMADTAPPCFGAGQCLELRGDACQAIKTDPDAVLRAGFPCEAAAP